LPAPVPRQGSGIVRPEPFKVKGSIKGLLFTGPECDDVAVGMFLANREKTTGDRLDSDRIFPAEVASGSFFHEYVRLEPRER
jgi:hypothetical protein